MSGSHNFDLEKIKALIEINTNINSNIMDADALLVSILEFAKLLVRCEAASLILAHKEDDCLRFAISLGPKSSQVKKIPVNLNSIAGWVYLNNKAQIINDVNSDIRFNDDVQSKTNYITKNMIAFPMCVDGQCIGVIELINKADNLDFDQEDLDVLTLLGRHAGTAYKNSKEYLITKNQVHSLQDTIHNGRDYHTFIAKSRAVKDLVNVINMVSKTNTSVLITGESGVGKELFAEQIHLNSPRVNKPLVRLSCAALSPGLLESELFGHVKGAFTDALCDKKGRFESADGGTLFLDEIGELPLDLQAKLLRVLQERKFEKVGSSKTICVDVRIIAATNRDLEKMVSQGTFRSDLYYRLNVMNLNIPPLRERKDDIMPLCEYFLEQFSYETKKNIKSFSSDAWDAIYSYYWPGNIRELENCVERACILCAGNEIQERDLCLPVCKKESPEKKDDFSLQALSSFEKENPSIESNKSLKNALTLFKKAYVTKILEESDWNQSKAAKVLDVQRTYVSKLISELDIKIKKADRS